MNKKFLYIILILFVKVNLYSSFDNTSHGMYYSGVLRLNVNPKCVAMGEACTSNVYDSSALDINPASIVKIRKKSLYFSHTAYFEGIKSHFISYSHKLSKNAGTVGVAVKYLDWGKIEKTNEFAVNVGEFSPSDMVVEIGFGSYLTGFTKDVEDRIVFGATGKFIRSKIENSASALSADIGFLFPYMFDRRLLLSFVVQNIMGEIKFDKKPFPLVKVIKFGGSVFISDNITINSDFIFPQDSLFYWAFGIETKINLDKRTNIALRGGFNTRNINDLEGNRLFSFGFGVRWWEYRIDYAFSPFGELGNTHRFSFSLNY